MRTPALHQVDGRMMTVAEIADMLGVSQNALETRRSKLGAPSYQVIVNMYRKNCFGNAGDRSPRYMVDGQWMSRTQIAQMLNIKPHTLTNWLNSHPTQDLSAAIRYYKQRQTGEQKRGHGPGRPSTPYRVGKRAVTIKTVAERFGVNRSSVNAWLKRHGGDMAAALRHYREREARQKRKAAKAIMEILGF